MDPLEQALIIYRDLAEHYRLQNEPGLREIFLVLAANAAYQLGQAAQAEQFRAELLRDSPYHLLKPYPSFAEAMDNPDIQHFVADLFEKYPREVAEDMLEPLLPGTVALGESQLPPSFSTPGPPTPPPAGRSSFPAPPRSLPQPPPTAPLPPLIREEQEPLGGYPDYPGLDQTQPPPTLPPQPAPLRGPRGLPRPTAPIPQPRPRPAPPPPAARPRPAPPPRVPASPPVRAQAPVAPPPQESNLTAGALAGTVLFMVVLAAGIALLVLTLLPPELFKK